MPAEIRIKEEDLSYIAHLFKSTRIKLNLRVVEVVREAGYKNIAKGCRRLRHIERGKEKEAVPVYKRFAQVLDIDWEELKEELRERSRKRRDARDRHLPPPRLGSLLRQARERRELSVEEVIDRIDFSDKIPEDADEEALEEALEEAKKRWRRRLRRLESGEARFPSEVELRAFAGALKVTTAGLRCAAIDERAVYDKQRGVPECIIRAVPGFYVQKKLPQGCSTLDAIDYAENFSDETNIRVCLIFPDRRALYFNPRTGRHENFRRPSMRLG